MPKKRLLKRKKIVTADLEGFKCAVDDLKIKLKNAKRHMRRRANFNPLWRI